MATDPHNLEKTLGSLPTPTSLPMALPAAHVTKARWFSVIVDKGQLEPQPDIFFKENTLYFFYGGVFYRPKGRHTRQTTELPVAFLFEPSILTSCKRYYPFDTGGMFSDIFGNWRQKMATFESTFKVNGGDYNVPSRMVHHFYGSNERYLGGTPDPQLKNKPAPLPLLFDFLTDDLSKDDVDHRQCIIEGQALSSVPLNRGLLWVGFPECFTGEFLRLLELLKPYVPQYWRYKSHAIFSPSEISAKLEEKAHEHVIARYMSSPEVPSSL